jgi:quercetin dioxygenase-like cupin family protein
MRIIQASKRRGHAERFETGTQGRNTMTHLINKSADGTAKMTRILKSILVAGMLMATPAIAGLTLAQAQQTAPTGNKGFKTTKSQIVELGPEIAGMEGRKLRLRLLTIEPGGYIGMHSHKDRPAVVYFLQGTDTVTFGDGSVKTFKPGDVGSATMATTHWHSNNGKEPAVFVAVDILHKK